LDTLVPEVYFSSPLRNENNKNKPLEPGYPFAYQSGLALDDFLDGV
jgi:hypothetical protein